MSADRLSPHLWEINIGCRDLMEIGYTYKYNSNKSPQFVDAQRLVLTFAMNVVILSEQSH